MGSILCKDSVYLTSVPYLQEICKPLQCFGIMNFIYVKNYRNGQVNHLSNRGDWLEHFYDHHLYRMGSFQQRNCDFSEGFLFWDNLSGQNVVKSAEHAFDMRYGIVLIEKDCDNCCEFYAFAGSHKTPALYDFYINNLDVLKRFILYFRDRGHAILKQSERERIQLPRGYHGPIDEFAVSKKTNQDIERTRETFVSKTKIQCCYCQTNNGDIELSGRELEIALHLLNTTDLMEISIQLNVSKRTIEKHLERLRRKFDCGNKQDLKNNFLQKGLKLARNKPSILF